MTRTQNGGSMASEEVITDRGVVIRNLTQVKDAAYSCGYSYTFQVQINGEWYDCSGPCGDWSFVKHPSFSVSVGWWELDDIYHKRTGE